MSFFYMKIRTLADASTALYALLEPLRRAISFADNIMSHEITNSGKAKIANLLTLYRSHNLNNRIENMACELRRQKPMLFSSKDRAQVEALMQHHSLNFFKPANAMQFVLAILNSSGSREKKRADLKVLLRKVDEFYDAAEGACEIVEEMKKIMCKYLRKPKLPKLEYPRISLSQLSSNHNLGASSLSLMPPVPGILKENKENNNSHHMRESMPSDERRITPSGGKKGKEVSFQADTTLRGQSPNRESLKGAATNVRQRNCPAEGTNSRNHLNASNARVSSRVATPSSPVQMRTSIVRAKSTQMSFSPTVRDTQYMRDHPNRMQGAARDRKKSMRKPDFDVFISHCGVDKTSMAIPLHKRLQKIGISSFCDRLSLIPGENAHDAMNHAMKTAPIGIFILSAEYAARTWPMRELSCFLQRMKKAKREGKQPPVLIPVYYRMTPEQSKKDLFDMQGSETSGTVCRKEGLRQRVEDKKASFAEIRRCFQTLSKISGIVNSQMKSANANTPKAVRNREDQLERMQQAIVFHVCGLER